MKKRKRKKAKKDATSKTSLVNMVSANTVKKQKLFFLIRKPFSFAALTILAWLLADAFNEYVYVVRNPVIEIVDDDNASPLSTTFSVENKSKTFAIKNFRLNCITNNALTEDGGVFNDIRGDTNYFDVIEPNKNKKIKCSISGKYNLLRADLILEIKYKIPFDEVVLPQIFTWNYKTKKWTKGEFAKKLE